MQTRWLTWLFAAGLGLTLSAGRPAGAALSGCPVFPDDHVWNTRVETLPVDPRSNDYVASIGAAVGLHPDFGSGTWNGAPIGIPFVVVPGSQGPVPVTFGYANESDAGPYPIPPNAPIEGGPASSGDRHVLIVDRDRCRLYELFAAYPQPDGSWHAGSGAIFDLRGYGLRTAGSTSADAAGLPILPGLVRYDEVAAGVIRHAIRFTAQVTQRRYVWPARHFASSNTSPAVPPMGQRFRLKASVDISRFSPEVRVILQAFKSYGLILADNGSDWYISGAPDPRWNNADLLSAFRQIHGSDFEAVETSSLLIHPDSGQARPPAPPVFGGGVFVAAADMDGVTGAAIVTGAGPGGGPLVRSFTSAGAPRHDFMGYGAGFPGGVRVAACDVNGDHRPDIVTAAGPGGGPHVRVFDGVTGAELGGFFAYHPGFTAGVFVACADVLGTGLGQIITGADAGGGPHVRVFTAQGQPVGLEFFAFSPLFSGGVRVAACDVDGDGRADIVAGAGPGGGPHVRIFDGTDPGRDLGSFFAYQPSFTGGVFVACGPSAAGPLVVTGADAGGGPHVQVFTPAGVPLHGFFAYGLAFTGGVRVAVGDVDGDGQPEIVTAPGSGGGPHVRAFTPSGGSLGSGFFAY